MKRWLKLSLLLVLSIFFLKSIYAVPLDDSDCKDGIVDTYCHDMGYMVNEFFVAAPHPIDGGLCFIGTVYDKSCELGCNELGCITKECSSDIECEKNMRCDLNTNQCYILRECKTNNDCYFDQECKDGECRVVDCACGKKVNHRCYPYECCDDSDCNENEVCDEDFNYCEPLPLCKPLIISEANFSTAIYLKANILVIGKSYDSFDIFYEDLERIFLNNESNIFSKKDTNNIKNNFNVLYIDQSELNLFNSGNILFEDILKLSNRCEMAETIIILTRENAQNVCESNICVYNVNTDYSFLMNIINDTLTKFSPSEIDGFVKRGYSFYLFKDNNELKISNVSNNVKYFKKDYLGDGEEYVIKSFSEYLEEENEEKIFFPKKSQLLNYDYDASFVRVLVSNWGETEFKIHVLDKNNDTKHKIDLSKYFLCNNNGVCDNNENIVDCPRECRCGNNICEEEETHLLCPFDCKKSSKVGREIIKHRALIITLILGLVMITSVLIYQMEKKKFQKKLKNYIKNKKKQGLSDHKIRKKLIDKGYDPKFLKKVLK